MATKCQDVFYTLLIATFVVRVKNIDVPAVLVLPHSTHSFGALSITTLLSHLRSVHSMDPHFHVTCGIDGCVNTLKTFPALYSRIYRHIQEASTNTSVDDQCDVYNNGCEELKGTSTAVNTIGH